ncbi:MAG: hypothetical protein ACK40H_06895 [Sphingomonadaceae bacterium]
MPLLAQSLVWNGCWNRDGLNFARTDLHVNHPGQVSAHVQLSLGYLYDTEGWIRAGIDRVEYRDGSVEEFFLLPAVVRTNVWRIGLRSEVLNARVRASLVVHLWA